MSDMTAPLSNEQIVEAANAAHADPDTSADTGTGAEADANTGAEAGAEDTAPKLSWEDAVSKADPETAELMRKMQADYTRKTQEVAEQKRGLKAEQQALAAAQALVAEQKDLPEYDPYDETSITARIEAEVNRRLNAVLKPMAENAQEQAAQSAYSTFLTANPEFKTDTALRAEVQAALEANDHLDLETAYWAVKGKRGTVAATAAATATAAQRAAARQAAIQGTGTGRKPGPRGRPNATDIKKMSNAEILAAAQAMSR